MEAFERDGLVQVGLAVSVWAGLESMCLFAAYSSSSSAREAGQTQEG